MTGIIKTIDDLAALESFDRTAFEADEKASQDVCNFVLALALIFNDLKDLLHANQLIQSQKPEGEFKITAHWGAYSGIDLHFHRLIIGLVNEFIKLIKQSEKVLEDPFFQSVIRQLAREERASWNAVLSATQGKQTDSPLGKFVLLVRNQLAFHYDPKEIYSGYKQFFSSGQKASGRAFISRGSNMARTRYYFADAAVKGCLSKKDSDKLLTEVASTLHHLNFVLMGIVRHFIQRRGYAFKTEKT